MEVEHDDAGVSTRVEALIRRLAETEGEIRALLPEGVDAVIDRDRRRPILLSDAQDALRASEARFRELVGQIPALVVELGPRGELLYANEQMRAVLGADPLGSEGGPFWGRVVAPASAGADVEAAFLAADVREMETRLRGADGVTRIVSWTSRRRMDAGGRVERVYAFGQDITPRLAAERELDAEREARRRAEMEKARSDFLADVSHLLSHIDDLGSSMRGATALAVGRLGTFCAIHLRGAADEEDSLYIAHADGRERARLAALWAEDPERESAHPVRRVLDTGETLVVHDDADSSGRAGEDAAPAAARAAGADHQLWAPMLARGEVLGVLSVGRVAGPPFDRRDVEVALEFGHRVAMAVENARIYRSAVEDAQAKSTFLAEMSHELRTPLNAVIGFGDLMLMDIGATLDEETKGHVRRIRSAANHLTSVVNGVLTFFRMEAGKEVVDPQWLDLRRFVEETADIVEPLALAKDLAFVRELPEGTATVALDGDKVRQVLINLLGNAVKYTDRGEVRLVCEPGGGRVTFRIVDTGHGMTPEDVATVFEPFRRGSGTTRASEGAGLGLAVTKRLVDLMGGRIEVWSEPGKGSEFLVTLPVAPARDEGGA